MTWMRRGDGRMSALVGRRGENRVRRAGLHLLTGVVMGLAPALLSGQMRMSMGSGAVITLPGGVMAVVAADADGLTVRGIVAEAGGGEWGALLEEGDRIASLQGKTISTQEAFTAAWGDIPEGAEVVLGIVRGGVASIVRFPRAPQQAEGRHMVVQGAGGGAGAWTAMGPPGGGPDEVTIAGARIRNNGEGMPEVVVRGSHPAAALVPFRVGDVIVSVNGRGIAALAGLDLFYAPLAVGDSVVVEVMRGGARETLRFTKPAER